MHRSAAANKEAEDFVPILRLIYFAFVDPRAEFSALVSSAPGAQGKRTVVTASLTSFAQIQQGGSLH
jgi:hypothetical protein